MKFCRYKASNELTTLLSCTDANNESGAQCAKPKRRNDSGAIQVVENRTPAVTLNPGSDFNQLRVAEQASPLEILHSQNHSGFLSIELTLLNSIKPILHSVNCI